MNKTEGAVDKCSSCGQQVYCNMKQGSGGYADKLQWQNKDGSAHYNYDFSKPEKERVSCNKSDEGTDVAHIPDTPEPPKPQELGLAKSNLSQKFNSIKELDELLAKVSMERLKDIQEKWLDIVISPEARLVFIESWSRTLAQTLR